MVPDTVIRAIAAAPDGEEKTVLLGSLGLTPELTSVGEKERLVFVKTLEQKYDKDKGEIQF